MKSLRKVIAIVLVIFFIMGLSFTGIAQIGHYVSDLFSNKTVDDCLEEINMLMTSGSYEEALLLVDQCLLHHKDIMVEEKAVFMETKGYLYSLLGDYDAAIKVFNNLGDNKTRDGALLELQILFKEEKDQAAIEALERFMINNPDDFDMRKILAELLYSRGQYDKALTQYEIIAEEMDEDKAAIFLMMGLSKQQLDSYAGSIEAFERALEMEYEDAAFVYYLMALSYFMLDADEEAVEYGERALESPSDKIQYSILYKHIGQSYLRLEDYPKSIENLNMAIEYVDIAESIYFYRGAAYMLEGSYDRAIADFEQAIAHHYRIDLSYYNRAVCKLQLNDVGSAKEDLGKAYELTESEEIRILAQEILDALR